MAKSISFFRVLLLLVIASTTFCACGDDDDDDFRSNGLETYIIGKWHSYKGVVTAYGERETVDITKNGDFSEAYLEIDFQKNGKAVIYAWAQDSDGFSRWANENCTYQVQGDEVILRDTSGDTVSLSFDSKEKALYYRVVSEMNSTQMTVFVYLRK